MQKKLRVCPLVHIRPLRILSAQACFYAHHTNLCLFSQARGLQRTVLLLPSTKRGAPFDLSLFMCGISPLEAFKQRKSWLGLNGGPYKKIYGSYKVYWSFTSDSGHFWSGKYEWKWQSVILLRHTSVFGEHARRSRRCLIVRLVLELGKTMTSQGRFGVGVKGWTFIVDYDRVKEI